MLAEGLEGWGSKVVKEAYEAGAPFYNIIRWNGREFMRAGLPLAARSVPAVMKKADAGVRNILKHLRGGKGTVRYGLPARSRTGFERRHASEQTL